MNKSKSQVLYIYLSFRKHLERILIYPVWTEVVNNWKEFIKSNISVSEKYAISKSNMTKIRKLQAWKMDTLGVSEIRFVAGQISDTVAIVFLGQPHIWRKVRVKIQQDIVPQLFSLLYSKCQMMSTRAIQFSGKTRFVQKQTKERKDSKSRKRKQKASYKGTPMRLSAESSAEICRPEGNCTIYLKRRKRKSYN